MYHTQKSAQVKLMPGNQLTSSPPCFLALTPAGGCIPGNLRLHAGPRESAVSVPSATTWATGASRGKGAPAQGHVCDARMSTAVTALFGLRDPCTTQAVRFGQTHGACMVHKQRPSERLPRDHYTAWIWVSVQASRSCVCSSVTAPSRRMITII